MRFRRQAVRALLVVASMIAAFTVATAGAPASAAAQRESNDAQFVRMMIPHHYQAVIMTRLVPERSTDDELRALAERIRTGQSGEIAAMRGWQGRQGLPVTDAEESYQELLKQPELLEEMGMATPDELDELRSARGEPFDVLFLQLMIPHHQGAIAMAEQYFEDGGGDPFVQQMATDIMDTQAAQVETMKAMLKDKNGEGS